MPKHIALDQFFSKLRVPLMGLSVALLMTACTTTTPAPTRFPGQPPVAERPETPPVQRPDETTPETPDEGTDASETKIDPSAGTDPDESDRPDGDTGILQPYVYDRTGLTPPHMAGRDTKRLALLLPFSSSRQVLRDEAMSMFRAAELAVFERNTSDVLLIALDTGGTESGAKTATQAALKSGADVILGPIIARNVQASAREARRSQTPLLAFSNDQTVAGNGTYLLSFPPEAEVNRVVEYVANQGATRFAFLGPKNAYGDRVKRAYEQAVTNRGGQVTASEDYRGADISVMQEPAQKLAAYHAEGERRAKSNGGTTPLSYEAILLPEGGNALRSLAPLLPYYDVDPADVQFMGTSRWDDEDTVREPALSGGIFAGPDKDARKAFESKFERSYGDEPSSLATLAYDAVVFGAFIADGNPKDRRLRAEDPKGFYGVDGLVSFDSDGRPQRGLAVYTIKNGQFVLLDPAPRTTGSGT